MAGAALGEPANAGFAAGAFFLYRKFSQTYSVYDCSSGLGGLAVSQEHPQYGQAMVKLLVHMCALMCALSSHVCGIYGSGSKPGTIDRRK